MNDFLFTHPDPVDEARHLQQKGDHTHAISILIPILKDIRKCGGTPSNALKALIEDLNIEDAAIYGTVTGFENTQIF